MQISDDNLHLVRSVLDEVFGSENFFSLITFRKASPLGTTGFANAYDFIIWYAKDKEQVKYRQLFVNKGVGIGTGYTWLELADGTRRKMTAEEKRDPKCYPEDTYFIHWSGIRTERGYRLGSSMSQLPLYAP